MLLVDASFLFLVPVRGRRVLPVPLCARVHHLPLVLRPTAPACSWWQCHSSERRVLPICRFWRDCAELIADGRCCCRVRSSSGACLVARKQASYGSLSLALPRVRADLADRPTDCRIAAGAVLMLFGAALKPQGTSEALRMQWLVGKGRYSAGRSCM